VRFQSKTNSCDADKRLTDVETRLNLREQKYLELETIEHVMEKVQSRVTRFAFFAGIPATIAALALAVIFGKGAITLENIASNARHSIEPLVSDAKSRAEETRNTIQQVQTQLKPTQEDIARLRGQTATSLGEVKQLDAQLRLSQSDVNALTARVNNEGQRVTQLQQQLKAAETQKSVTAVRALYPSVYGEYAVMTNEGFLDPKTKKPGDIYVTLLLAADFPEARKSQVRDVDIAAVAQALRQNGYTVFQGMVTLVKTTGTTSIGMGMSIDRTACSGFGLSASLPPCIVYFHDEQKGKIEQLRKLVQPAQEIPVDRVLHGIPMHPLEQKLIDTSLMDFVIVLGPA
jgi:polyhydroxyalkanoate synthesis regulator phasin